MIYPKTRVKKVFEKAMEGTPVSVAMAEEGYSPNTAKNPKNITESKGWKELMEERLSDDSLSKKHEELLNSTKLDHMIFPLGPKDEKNDPNPNLAPEIRTVVEAQLEMERTKLTDGDIKQMLQDANCIVRKIVHGNTGRHVYFWAADNKARKEALDMAYKLKGFYAPERSISLNLNGEMIADERLLEIATKLNEVARISPGETNNTGGSVSSDGADTDSVDTEVQNQNV